MKHHADLRKKIEDYSYGLNDIISSTDSSKIYKGMKEATKQPVAIKVVDNKKLKTKQETKALELSIEVLRKAKHPNIVKCLDVYTTMNNCYIVTEYCSGGDLETILNERKEKLPLEEVVSIFKDIIKGYKNMYLQGYVHRNLDLSNILIKNGECKINDFGLASKEVDIPSKVLNPITVSPYRSPQSLKSQTLGPKCDIWAFGIILYRLLHHRFPFQNYDNKFAFKDLIQFDEIPINAKQLIQKCLQHPSLRITFPEFQAHQFITEIMSVSPNNIITLKGDFNIPITRVTCKVQPKITPEMEKAKYQKVKKGQVAAKSQIGFMRFLFRLQDILPESDLKFLVIKHLLTLLNNLKSCFQTANPFNCDYMNQFFQSDRSRKMNNVIQQYVKKYAKVQQQFQRLIRKGTKNKKNLQYFDSNLTRSQGFVISILPTLITTIQTNLKELTTHKDLSFMEPEQYLTKQLQAMTVKLDFCVTYYQLICLAISDWNNILSFAEYCKIDEILENVPSEMQKLHIKSIESKINQLEI